eukprot:CAMPEP_0116860814 /NCGR_PEP_ID=MMETSP0418-20121206/22640_1 /TAXON_ID=1158023 /ORGANISM="Astrosyne radiata, Strain 13vi08-1A" /LENGTH=233 /DNA_ID=CAMNT_0004495295 /DNA_START=114 /DNA_END=815 /DNA_ORIENTATION=-
MPLKSGLTEEELMTPLDRLHEQLFRMRADKPWAVSRGTVPVENGPNSFVLGDCTVTLSFWEKFDLMELSTPIFHLVQSPDVKPEEYYALMAMVKMKVAMLDKDIQGGSHQEMVLVIRDRVHVYLLRQTPMSMLNEEEMFRFRRVVDDFCKVAKKAKAEMASIALLDPTDITAQVRAQVQVQARDQQGVAVRRRSLGRSLSKNLSRRSLLSKQKSDSQVVIFGSFRRKKTAQAA